MRLVANIANRARRFLAACLVTPFLLGNAFAEPRISDALAVRVAKAIGDYAGYTPNKIRIMDYDIVDPVDRPGYAGFVTVQIMVNAHSVFFVSINRTTGQALDFTYCFALAYPVIARVERKNGFKGAPPLSYGRMLADNGCESYVVLRRPDDAGRDLPSHETPDN